MKSIPYCLGITIYQWSLPPSTSLLSQPFNPPAPSTSEGAIDAAKACLVELVGFSIHVSLHIGGKIQEICRGSPLIREVAKVGKRWEPRPVRNRQSDQRSRNEMGQWQQVVEQHAFTSASPLGFRQVMGLLQQSEPRHRTSVSSLLYDRGATP